MRVFWKSPGNSPSRITGLPLVLPQSLRHSGTHHVFAEPTLSHIVSGRNWKNLRACEKRVDDGTSLWKQEENLELISFT
jgi:hypothetical protein